MKRMVLISFVLITLVACHDKDDALPETPAKTWRLSTLIVNRDMNGYPYEISQIGLKYDNTDKISAVKWYMPMKQITYTYTLTYDSGNRLARFSYDSSDFAFDFKYTANGLLSDALVTEPLDYRYHFVYGAAALPEKCIQYINYTADPTPDSIEYVYTWQNGNVVQRKSIFPYGIGTKTETYEYTDLPNFSSTINLIGFSSTMPVSTNQEFVYFNKNAMKQINAPDLNPPTTTSIKYDSRNGRLLEDDRYGVSGLNISEENRRYVYERR